MFLSVLFTVEHGISESNIDQGLKFGCRSVNDLRRKSTQWAAIKHANLLLVIRNLYIPYTILLLRKSVKLDVRALLNYNAMFYQTFTSFCLNGAKRACLNHCSWLLDDVE